MATQNSIQGTSLIQYDTVTDLEAALSAGTDRVHIECTLHGMLHLSFVDTDGEVHMYNERRHLGEEAQKTYDRLRATGLVLVPGCVGINIHTGDVYHLFGEGEDSYVGALQSNALGDFLRSFDPQDGNWEWGQAIKTLPADAGYITAIDFDKVYLDVTSGKNHFVTVHELDDVLETKRAEREFLTRVPKSIALHRGTTPEKKLTPTEAIQWFGAVKRDELYLAVY